MKLHLNLTLRRALMAAMAVVSLQTTQAELTTEPNNLHTYLYGTGELTPDLWNSIWNATPKPSTLTIGNYLGAADATLSSSTYNNGKDIYIGGVGYDSNQEVANDGKLSTITGTVLNVNHLSLGNSLVGGTGTLAMNGGTVNVTSSLYVGVNRGYGAIETTNGAVIKVGTNKTGAVFTMSHRKEPSLNDTVTLTGSSITVGAAGGVRDYTSIGHSAGTATLNLESGSTAHFYDQLLVGEMSGSNGTINVGKKDTDTSKSTLTLASTTVLGYESGAHGTINIYDGTVNVGAKSKDDILVIGHKGSGKVKIKGGTLDAGTGTILLGAELGANPEDAESTPDLHLEGGKAIAQNLIIGGAGRSSVKVETDAILEVHDIVIDGTDTSWSLLTLASGAQVGIQGTDGTRRIDNLFIGGDDRNGHLDNNTTLTVGNTIIGRNGMAEIKKGGSLTTDYLLVQSITDPYKGLTIEGKTTVNGAFVTTAGSKVNVLSGGTLTTSGGTTPTADGGTQNTIVAGTLTIENDGVWEASGDHSLYGTISNSGIADIASATAFSSATITNNAGGTLTIGTLVNSGTISNAGATIENGEEIKPAGTIDVTSSLTNYGTISNGGTWTTAALTNLGTISNTGTWNAKGETTSTEGTIANNGTITSTGKVVTGAVTTDGSGNWNNNGSWTITGQTEVTVITNNKDITITGAGRVVGNSLTGTGTTTIAVDKTTVNGTVVNLTQTPENKDAVKVTLDMSNTADLVGKDLTFLSSGTLNATADNTNDISLVNADQNSTGIDWTESYIDINGTSNKLWFTSDYANNAVSKMKFTKMAEFLRTETDVTTKESDTSVTLEYEKQTLVTEEKTVDTNSIEENSELAKAIMGKDSSAPTLQTVVVETEKDNIVGSGSNEDAKPVNIIVASGLTESTGLVVETVVVKQVTKDEGTGDVSSKTAGTSGLALVFSGESKQAGVAENKDTNHLGFADNLKGASLTTVDGMDKKVQTIDLVEVKADSNVTLGNLNMHSTHNFVVKEGATLTFDGVNLKVGGSHDDDIEFQDVQVEVEKEDANGTKTIVIETVRVENKESAHMETGSMIGEANADTATAATTTVHITNGSKVEFEKVYAGNGKEEDELGTTTIAGANTLVQMSGENTTLGMDKVLKDDAGKPVLDDRGHEKHGQQIVFDHGAHLKGTGHLKNIHMKEGTTFTVGNSPGKFTASELTVDGVTNFYLIVDSNDWENYKKTGDAKDLTADERKKDAADGEWGAISQLVVAGPVTLNGEVRFTYQKWDPSVTDDNGNVVGGFVNLTEAETQAAREDLGEKFAEGSSIKFVTGNVSNLTLGSGFWVNEDTLPELEDGLFWDVSSLFNDCTVYVIGEILEEPSRIANTLVSAGETVLNFGRLAEAQASLREAGTTRTWGSAIAMFDSIDSGSSTIGYDYNTWGAAVGVDHAFTKNTVVGVAFGCTWGENEAKEGNGNFDGGSIDQEARMIGIYGVHKFRTKGLMNDVKLNAFAAYGMFENDSTRTALKTGNKAKAEWDSDAWVLSASLSRDITTDTGVVFTPYVGVEYTTAGMDDFTEQGRKTADYSADEDYSKLSVKVGVGVSKTYGSFTPYANVAFISDVARNAAEVTAVGRDTVTGKSALPGRNGFEIGVGATWQLTENLDVNAGYSAEIRDKATEHNARVGIGYTF